MSSSRTTPRQSAAACLASGGGRDGARHLHELAYVQFEEVSRAIAARHGEAQQRRRWDHRASAAPTPRADSVAQALARYARLRAVPAVAAEEVADDCDDYYDDDGDATDAASPQRCRCVACNVLFTSRSDATTTLYSAVVEAEALPRSTAAAAAFGSGSGSASGGGRSSAAAMEAARVAAVKVRNNASLSNVGLCCLTCLQQRSATGAAEEEEAAFFFLCPSCTRLTTVAVVAAKQ